MTTIRHIPGGRGLALAIGIFAVALAPGARADGEGTANYMPDRVAETIMQQAAAAGMRACEAVLIPTGTAGTYRVVYRVVAANQPQVARPTNSMSAVVQSSACPR